MSDLRCPNGHAVLEIDPTSVGAERFDFVCLTCAREYSGTYLGALAANRRRDAEARAEYPVGTRVEYFSRTHQRAWRGEIVAVWVGGRYEAKAKRVVPRTRIKVKLDQNGGFATIDAKSAIKLRS